MSVPRPFSRRREDPAGSADSTTIEPCLHCGDGTAAGTALYSDRLEIERSDGGRAYLCADCHAKARAARNGQPLTEADLQAIGDNGLMIGAGFIAI